MPQPSSRKGDPSPPYQLLPLYQKFKQLRLHAPGRNRAGRTMFSGLRYHERAFELGCTDVTEAMTLIVGTF